MSSEYSQGVAYDGAAILKDGQPMTIDEIVGELRSLAAAQAEARELQAELARLRERIKRLTRFDPVIVDGRRPGDERIEMDAHHDGEWLHRGAVLAALSQPAEQPNCGACPGDDSICPERCRLAGESPRAEQPAAPEADLPLMARRAEHPSDAGGVMYEGAQRLCFIHGELNPPAPGFVTYRIADTDENGLPVVERTADMPEGAKYRYGPSAGSVMLHADKYTPRGREVWQRIEDYNEHAEPAQRGDVQ